jgi:N-acetyl-gamma-glutamyl-phosphate reductase
MLATLHPDLTLVFATSDKSVGEAVAPRLGLPASTLRFTSHDDGVKLSRGVDVVVLASSAEHAVKLAPVIAEHARVVDLSGAFRLDAAAYPTWYGFEHAAPSDLARAFYGLPELFGAPPKDTRIVANPGCYATAALLATAPLLADRLAEPGSVIIDGKSGISGAGRRAEERYSFVELAEEVRAYKVGTHAHTPEIARYLQRHARVADGPRVTFTPHLVPLRRGLVVTAYMTARSGATTESVRASLEKAYAQKPFVTVVGIEDVSAHAATGTPLAVVGACVTGDTIVSMCALDNLMKGAASQAMQNVNALLGLPEAAGLSTSARFAP